MEELKINMALEPGKYYNEKGIEIEFRTSYMNTYVLNIGDGIVIQCRNKKKVIETIKKVSKYLLKVEK